MAWYWVVIAILSIPVLGWLGYINGRNNPYMWWWM